MAASTIPNSGGPGSTIELSPVTIAVRDKVIEKFADQPLDEMNESVKQLLFKEEDEQKRLGILAARVYILRQRILRISEGDPDRVVGSASPKANDLMANSASEQDSEPLPTEWTRLRIINDCEVNGVRFPKTVDIDVKAEDAEKLIANGNAKLVEDQPTSSPELPAENITDNVSEETAQETKGDDTGAEDTTFDNAAGDDATEDKDAEDKDAEDKDAEDKDAEDTDAEDTGGDDAPANDIDELSALSAALGSTPPPEMEVTDAPEADTNQESGGEAVIDAPSAAEVTAALEALGTGDMSDSPDEAVSAKTTTPTMPDAAADAADVAAELEALSASLASSDDGAPTSGMTSDAADVAAELQAATAAMAADPAGETAEEQTSESGPETAADDAEKPSGWFEAQQKAEQSSATDTSADGPEDGSDEDKEEPDNAKP
jgi:hypothetical protein